MAHAIRLGSFPAYPSTGSTTREPTNVNIATAVVTRLPPRLQRGGGTIAHFRISLPNRSDPNSISPSATAGDILKQISKAFGIVDVCKLQSDKNRFAEALSQNTSLSTWSSAQLSEVVLGCATHGIVTDSLFSAFSKRILEIDRSTWQLEELTDIVYSFAKANRKCPPVLDRVIEQICVRDLSTWMAAQICTVIDAYAHFKRFDDMLFNKLCDTLTTYEHAFSLQELDIILKAYAQAINSCEESSYSNFQRLFDMAGDTFIIRPETLKNATEGQICSLLRSYYQANLLSESLKKCFINAICQVQSPSH